MRDIEDKVNSMFLGLGFKKELINNEILYVFDNCYYKITYIRGLKSFVIEYAEGIEDTIKGLFVDGDLYPISLGDSLIQLMTEDLKQNYM